MLEKLLSKYLTKKGKIMYIIGLILSFALVAYYVLGIKGHTMDTGRDMFIYGCIIVNILWAGICFVVWRNKEEQD